MRKLFFLMLITSFVSCGMSEREKAEKLEQELLEARIARQDSIRLEKEKAEMEKSDFIEKYLNDIEKIEKYTVTKVSGKDSKKGTTNIEYRSVWDMLREADEKSEKEMWTNEKKQSTIDTYKKSWLGGMVVLTVKRNSIESANLQWFEIIVKDKDDNEIYRKGYDSKIPNTPIGDDLWWDTGVKVIDVPVYPPFNIYVVDRMSSDVYQFEITAK